jgi:hypothetical protein
MPFLSLTYQGAADYWITGYYLWGPIIENLADLGYEKKR